MGKKYRKFFHRTVKRWHKTKLSGYFKHKRFKRLLSFYLGNNRALNTPLKVLDIGCGTGRDFLNFVLNNQAYELHGVDIAEHGILGNNFTFTQCDAESLPFPDMHFDLTVSFGVLEHIEPIEKLCRVIAEINRVSKAYYIIVPSIATPVEPHLGIPFWQLKDHNKKQKAQRINYFSDEAWLKFNGFSQALVKRQYYIPLLKQDLLIYKHNAPNSPQ